MADTETKGDRREAKRRKSRYGMMVSGKSAQLHHVLGLQRGLSKRVREALQRVKGNKTKGTSGTSR